MKPRNSSFITTIAPFLLICCFILFAVISWILIFRDPRAVIGISNLYPSLKTFLFTTQDQLAHYGINSIPTILFALAALVAIFSYLVSLTSNISLKKTVVFAGIFGLITFLSYPLLSTDIFSYIFSERVATVHHANIWQVTPQTFYLTDQFGVLSDWRDTTSIYGWMHYFLYLGPALLGQNDLLTLLILYKFVPTIFAVGSGYMLYLLLQKEKKEVIAQRLRLVFWNPLVILELFGSGHNDSMMLFFSLLSYYLFEKNRWLLSGCMLALAVQVKLIPIVFFFFLFLALVRKKAFFPSLHFIAGFLSVNVLLFSFMQTNLLQFLQRVSYNGGVYWQSLGTALHPYLPKAPFFLSVLFLLWVILYTIRIWWKQTSPLLSYVTVIFIYLVFVTSAYWNWYILWILLFTPLLSHKRIAATIILISFTSLLAYPLLWISQRFNYHSPIWPPILYLFIFGIPLLAVILMRYSSVMRLADRLTMPEKQ